METKGNIIKNIKKTHIGSALAWLCIPRKHYGAVKYNLQKQLPYPPTRKQVWWCFWDYFKFRLLYLGNLEVDYFAAQLYRKSDFVRKESLAHGDRFRWRDQIQEKENWNIFLDKRAFNHAFSEHLHRKWLEINETTTWDEFLDFIKACSSRVFVKNPISNGGQDVHYLNLKNIEECEELFKICVDCNNILEEPLTQCEEIYSFSNGAINTLRIITIIDLRGDAHVARCELRIARSNSAIDNYCSGGLVAQVDIASGVVYSMARNAEGKEFIFHPDTEKQIVGYKIPDWENYKRFACKLAQKFPAMRYVGWDILKDEKGNFCVIEGNKDAGISGLESGLLYGLKPSFDAILNGEEHIPYYR